MKMRQRFAAIFAAAFLLAGSFPVPAVKADQPQDEVITAQDSAAASSSGSTTGVREETEETSSSGSVTGVSEETKETSSSSSVPGTSEETEETSSSSSVPAISEEAEETSSSSSATGVSEETEETSSSSSAAVIREETDENADIPSSGSDADEREDAEPSVSGTEIIERTETAEGAKPSELVDDLLIPDEPPAFHARIEYWMGYTVIGTFTDFTPDIVRIDTLYSLDEEHWRAVTGGDWNLYGLEDDDSVQDLYDQPCVYNAYEPMKSYTTGDIDRFYLKLRITRQNGLFYDTQTATIEHDGIQSVPDGIERYACFPASMAVREPDPDSSFRFRMYGRYQITIPADATAGDVSALLPDTLPVEVQLYGRNFKVNGVVECPVTWKPLSLPTFSAGETITIVDAAEDIIVPAGTLLSTPLGIFELDEPLSVDNPPCTDEVRLVLNVSPEDRNLTGTLKQAPDGLTVALHQKPTGAVLIEAYVLTEGASEWTEIPGRSLLKEMNGQQATESSGFALVLYNDEEPYRSYLEADKAGTESTPFFIGLKINGGIYDDRQLILAWPDVYEEIPDLPRVGRSEGNEGNAGAANKDDSTEGGQRPNLPQTLGDGQEEQMSNLPQTPDVEQKGHKPVLDQTPETAPVIPENQDTLPTDQEDNDIFEQPDAVPQEPETAESGQRPNLPRIRQDAVNDAPSAEQNDTAKEKDSPMTFEMSDTPAQSPAMVQAEIDGKDDGNTLVQSNAGTAVGRTTEKNGGVPILPAAAVVAVGSCIGVAAWKTATGKAATVLSVGNSVFARIVKKIRHVLRK